MAIMKTVNPLETYVAGKGFSRTEINETSVNDVKTTIIYAGHSPFPTVSALTLESEGWEIRKTVIVENSVTGQTTVMETWGSGAWNNKENLEYKYI